MTNRMLRHMHMLTFVDLSREEIASVFETICGTFLRLTFGDELAPLSKPIVAATINVYYSVMDTLKPTPEKPHYTFNLRDVSKVVQGVLMADKRRGREREDIVRLWTHECCRVFSDRLINDKDRTWFLEQVKEQTKAAFSLQYSKVVSQKDGELMYSDFLVSAEPTIYEEVTDMGKLAEIMNSALGEYNEMNIPMNLVLFADAMAHVCRISRVLRQPGGNCLLLGVGGSGRQSLTRLASHLVDFRVFQIEITKNYRVLEWREDLKTVLKMGYELKPVVFLFVDTQITDEIFLENVNNSAWRARDGTPVPNPPAPRSSQPPCRPPLALPPDPSPSADAHTARCRCRAVVCAPPPPPTPLTPALAQSCRAARCPTCSRTPTSAPSSTR